MKSLSIIPIKCGSLDTDDLVEMIKGQLRRRNKYREDLMYRGVKTDQEGLRSVQQYGTDRHPNYKMARMMKNIDELAAVKKIEKGLGIEEDLSHLIHVDISFNEAWLLPERCLDEVIDIYADTDAADNEPEKPYSMILVYNPDFLISSQTGKAIADRPRDDLDIAILAHYKFKTASPRDAFVAAFQLDY